MHSHHHISNNLKKANNKYVYVRTITWFRDSHGLFDYDAARYNESDLYMEKSAFINRDGNDGAQISEHNLDIGAEETFRSEFENSKTLASVVEIDNNYYLYNKASKIVSNREKIWWVIKSFKANRHGFKGHKLIKGDKV